MSHPDDGARLDELADAMGVVRRYHDGIGVLRHASDEALVAVLRALGAPLQRREDAATALEWWRAAESRQPRVVCADEGEPCEIDGCGRYAHIVLEDGIELALHTSEARATLPADLPAGYHRLETDCGTIRVLVAPKRLGTAPRSRALFAPLYAIRHEDGRFASYSDLAALGAWMRQAPPSGRPSFFVGTLPLLACFFEQPFEPSPYSPISRAFWSELYVDVSGWSGGEAAATRVDYRGEMQRRRGAIEASLAESDALGWRDKQAFEGDLAADPELGRYAAFRATVEKQGRTWESWSSAAQGGDLRPGIDFDPAVARYHAWAQWLARRQLASAAAEIHSPDGGLYLDLPLGAHGGGYETWRYRGDFAFGISAGAPPDAVFEGGQNWAFPPLHPIAARANLYAPLRAALRHHFEHASLLRIDHVMSLHRLFWIADGFTAADGVYVRYRPRELWSVLAIEASRARDGAGAAVVGEDLGTVPDEVRRELHDRGALGMHVVPFQCRHDSGAAIAPARRETLASLGTHDMEPFASWWDGEQTPRGEIAAFLGCAAEPADVLEALVAWLGASDATVVCANLEDFWLERARQNLPGTDAGEANWQRPFAWSLERLVGDAKTCALRDLLGGTIETGGDALCGDNDTEARP
jgi:4-alpha-glucanotransferase